MRVIREHVVVVPRSDGVVELQPMKEWLRQHPEQVPPGMNPTRDTSHALRAALRRLGWSMQQTETQVRLVPPGHSVAGTFLDEEGDAEDTDDSAENAEGAAFSLESQLRDFLAENIASITVDGRRLRLFVDETGRDGIEYHTGVGFIDILAVDESGAFVVFELKRGRSPDHVVGQVTRYMGWVSQTVGRGHEVRGVVVAKQISDTLRYAASVVPGLSLFEYEVSFRLLPATQLPQS